MAAHFLPEAFSPSASKMRSNPLDMTLGLLQVFFEPCAKVVRLRGLGHLWQRLGQLFVWDYKIYPV
jgi:hypothetical protein